MLNFDSTIWDILELKFLVLFVTMVIAVYIGNWLYHRKNDHNQTKKRNAA